MNFTDEDRAKILQVKTSIKQKLNDVFYNTRNEPLPSKVSHALQSSTFLSGGCIASLLNREPPNDYDMYFKNESTMNEMKKFFTDNSRFVSTYQENYRELEKDVPSGMADAPLITESAITLKNKIQLIIRNSGPADLVRKTFDFVHCMPYYDLFEDKLYISYPQYMACINKKLIVNNAKLVTQKRTQKLINRGFRYG